MESKKKELEGRLLSKRGFEGFAPLSGREVQEFLELSAKGRKLFFQYTDLNAVVGMLNSCQLWLTRGTDLNDPKEFGGGEMAKRTYVASFSRSTEENVAMWWLYGLRGLQNMMRIPVRIQLKGNALQAAVASAKEAYVVGGERDGDRLAVETPVLCDVLYQYSPEERRMAAGPMTEGHVRFENRNANGIRQEMFDTTWEVFSAYVKDRGWEYEKETRCFIRLAPGEKGEGIQRIAIPIEEALHDIEVRVGPGEGAERYRKAVEKKLVEEGFEAVWKGDGGAVGFKRQQGNGERPCRDATQYVKVEDSQCSVRFKWGSEGLR